MNSLFGKFILNIIEYLADKPDVLKYEMVLNSVPSNGTGVEVKELQ